MNPYKKNPHTRTQITTTTTTTNENARRESWNSWYIRRRRHQRVVLAAPLRLSIQTHRWSTWGKCGKKMTHALHSLIQIEQRSKSDGWRKWWGRTQRRKLCFKREETGDEKRWQILTHTQQTPRYCCSLNISLKLSSCKKFPERIWTALLAHGAVPHGAETPGLQLLFKADSVSMRNLSTWAIVLVLFSSSPPIPSPSFASSSPLH